MSELTAGSKVPIIKLKDQNGEEFDISKIIGKKNLVIFFYPKNETPGCTAEACSFRDAYEDFQEMGAEVIGISGDGSDSHEKFARRHNLPYTLLSDPGDRTRKLFGVPRSFFGLIPGRTTYIVDKEGTIVHIFNSQVNPQKHVEIAKEVLQNINDN